MIIVNGDIASAITDRDDLLFFASGVSNSQETRESEYQREKDLLLAQDPNAHVVYFGSLSVFYNNNRYGQHKLEMEKIVKSHFKRWTIFRLGNISWGTNPHTIINFFRAKVERGEELEVRDTYRYVIDKDEFQHWISLIPEWNCEMNLTGQKLTIKEIINKYVYTGIHIK